jgi:ATP-dependent exoDNAse (exonuclease V) alpha subunit
MWYRSLLRRAFSPIGENKLMFYGGIMAIYHLSIKIISRGKGKSAVAAAAYRAGEIITNNYDGITHDYSRKKGVVHTEILLPENAPIEYSNRSILWNSVEKIEKAKNSQLAREIELALPVELTIEQNISLVRDYVKQQFVSAGMVADVCIHDTGNGNPHAHIMLTLRPFNKDKSWGSKQRKKYILDCNGNKIYDKNKRQYKCKSIPATDWDEQSKAEEWRSAWAESVNAILEQQNISERIDHRSYERQGIEQFPTIHLGVAASQMERKGIVTERGNRNREVEKFNSELRQLRARIIKLNNWIKTESTTTESPTLYSVIQNILSQQSPTWKSRCQTISNVKSAAKVLIFLQNNNITDMAGLEAKVRAMYSEQAAIRNKLNPIERRFKTLDEHIKQADYYFEFKNIYRKYQSMNPKYQAEFRENHHREITLYEAAERYLNGVMNGRTKIPKQSWIDERARLIAEKDVLYREYCSLKNEVGEAEKIRRNVSDIMKSESQKSLNAER